jgi:hypothetical protein
MKILPVVFLFFSSVCLAENPPQDIRLDSGSMIILQQYIESRPDADPSFPVMVNMTCEPKMKMGKIAGYKCQASTVKYATKAQAK